MTATQTSLHHHISDMKAATDHILGAVQRQAEDAEVQKFPEVAGLIGRIQTTLQGQSQALESQLKMLGETPADGLKSMVTAVTGTLTGLYDKVRSHTVSRNLRDDYTALSLATVSNSMLHVTALAAGDQPTAALALRNMQELAPFIVQLGESILPVVERELSADFSPKPGSAQLALENVRKVWGKN